MVETKGLHRVFSINPIYWKSLTERYVKITLGNGETLTGTLYTIDPVSQSYVLLSKEESGALSLKIVLNNSVESIEKVPGILEEELSVIPENAFKSDNYVPLSETTKEDVKNWLIKNMIPVVESDDKLVIDSLEIHPPYGPDQCYSDNSIVLARIRNLLSQMPSRGLS